MTPSIKNYFCLIIYKKFPLQIKYWAPRYEVSWTHLCTLVLHSCWFPSVFPNCFNVVEYLWFPPLTKQTWKLSRDSHKLSKGDARCRKCSRFNSWTDNLKRRKKYIHSLKTATTWPRLKPHILNWISTWCLHFCPLRTIDKGAYTSRGRALIKQHTGLRRSSTYPCSKAPCGGWAFLGVP